MDLKSSSGNSNLPSVTNCSSWILSARCRLLDYTSWVEAQGTWDYLPIFVRRSLTSFFEKKSPFFFQLDIKYDKRGFVT